MSDRGSPPLLRPPPAKETGVLTWEFHGGEDGSDISRRRGTQRCLVGDLVVHEVFAMRYKILRLEGAYATLLGDDGNETTCAFKVFDHRHWPVHETTLQDYGVDKITQLQEIYGEFLLDDMENELLDQWSDMKVTIMKSEGLRNRDFHDLWAQMLVQYNSHYTYVLRLVAIALMVPVDTSECERVFSLMNDLKTSERNALGQANLRILMVWHTAAKDLACADLPVMSILKKFRELSSSSTKGRYAHRPTEPPVYDYEETMS